jgi:hypothetical protein
MRYGPFYLPAGVHADFLMQIWVNNPGGGLCQMVSTDNQGYSGNCYKGPTDDGFVSVRIDLSNLAGGTPIWVEAYYYGSSVQFTESNGYVDDFVVRYCTDACPDTSASAAPAPAGVPVQMTLPER